MATAQGRRLGRGTYVGYALGSLATGTFGTVPGLLLLYFLTDTLGVAAGLASVTVLLPKLWDVFWNPLVGGWSDRTHTRWGARRPWMFAGSLILPVFFVAMFAAPTSLSWVTSTNVWPRSRLYRRRIASTSSARSESRLPVGSSASTRLGPLTSARAMATRCCSPPESSDGR